MNKGYYITSSREKVALEAAVTIDVSHKNIVELVLPEGVQYVYCSNNQLTTLTLPEGVQTVYCDDLIFDVNKYLGKDININIVCR